jgi:hypothetical protein
MSNADLKTAMDSLQVRKPLRLPSRTPVFTPPAATLDTNPTKVQDTTQVEIPTQVRDEAKVGKENQVTNETVVKSETPATDLTQVFDLTQVSNATVVTKTAQVASTPSVQNLTSVEMETQVGKPTQLEAIAETDAVNSSATMQRRATEQDSSVMLEAQAEGKLARGYTRVPNAILMRLISGDFTKNEIKLALLIARFTISFQRKKAPLSKAVLERQTGLRGAAILEALSGLVSKGMIEKEKGDQHRPNMLGLILPEGWDTPSKPQGPTQAEITTKVRNPTEVRKTTTAEAGKATEAEVGKPAYLKDIKTIENKNSLSTLPEVLQKYFSELKPAKKRESEWKAFESLLSDYSAEDISDCFTEIQTRGVPVVRDGVESTEHCHSPMAFLSRAIGEILGQIQTKRVKALERAEREQRAAMEQQSKLENESREAAEWAIKDLAFRRAFPTAEDQSNMIAKLCVGTHFRPHTEAGRAIAITRWWEELKNEDQANPPQLDSSQDTI